MAIEKIDYNKCISCQRCFDICPTDVFGVVGEQVYLAYPEDCARCFLCERVCPCGALEVNALPVIPLPDPFQDLRTGNNSKGQE